MKAFSYTGVGATRDLRMYGYPLGEDRLIEGDEKRNKKDRDKTAAKGYQKRLNGGISKNGILIPMAHDMIRFILKHGFITKCEVWQRFGSSRYVAILDLVTGLVPLYEDEYEMTSIKDPRKKFTRTRYGINLDLVHNVEEFRRKYNG